MTLRRALAAFVAAGCLFLVVEVLIEHREILGEEWVAWAPIVACGLVCLISFWAFVRWRVGTQKAMGMVSAVMLVVGLAGVYFHNADRLEHEEEHEVEAYEESEQGEEGHHPPVLAPLAIFGVGVLGLMASYSGWREEKG